jgi:16S rRNA (adenine(1408)-N(1))-methyltransferase
MNTIRGRKADALTRDQLLAVIASYTATTLDVGAGDGAWAYRYAATHPERFVIALDPVGGNMREWSAKAARRPAKGGLPNVLFAVGSVEQPPPELRAVADEIFVTLPWGSLMRGLILADGTVLDGLASFACDGAAIRTVLNTRIFDDPVPIEAQDLPEVTPDYVRDTLAEPYARHGLALVQTRWMDAHEVAAIGTTWAKRLSHRSPPRSVLIVATHSLPAA